MNDLRPVDQLAAKSLDKAASAGLPDLLAISLRFPAMEGEIAGRLGTPQRASGCVSEASQSAVTNSAVPPVALPNNLVGTKESLADKVVDVADWNVTVVHPWEKFGADASCRDEPVDC